MSKTQPVHKLPGTYGIVVCGGQSSRMTSDKSLLTYYEKPQRYHIYELLAPFCEKVFISCNKEQASSIEPGYNYLPDDPVYENTGPMAALLTAFAHFPKKNILLIGCDYPFLTAAELQGFLTCCKADKPAAFYNAPEYLFEPLLAWYPYQSLDTLKKKHEEKQHSLQQFLKDMDAVKYHPQDVNSIKSIDTPEAFKDVYNMINS